MARKLSYKYEIENQEKSLSQAKFPIKLTPMYVKHCKTGLVSAITEPINLQNLQAEVPPLNPSGPYAMVYMFGIQHSENDEKFKELYDSHKFQENMDQRTSTIKSLK